MVIKAVIFDGDSTLFYGLKKEVKIQQLLKRKGILFSQKKIRNASDVSTKIRNLLIEHELFNLGEFAYLVENGIRLVLLGVDQRKVSLLAKFIHKNWTKAAKKELYKDVRPTLKWLHKKKYKIGLLTAGPTTNYKEMLKGKKVIDYFDSVVGEDLTNAPKPVKAAYVNALRSLNVRASEAIMVGDHVENDYTSPRKFGMAAVLLDRNAKGFSKQKINKLDQLIKVLDMYALED